MRVRIGHKVSDARRTAGVARLLKARRIKAGANRVRADDGDGLALVARRGDKAGSFTRGVDLGWVSVAHFKFQCSVGRVNRLKFHVVEIMKQLFTKKFSSA